MTKDDSTHPVSGFFSRPTETTGDGASRRVRRPWEGELPFEEIEFLLRSGRFVDLLARLTDLRNRRPYDAELLRSVRVLEWHLRTRMKRASSA